VHEYVLAVVSLFHCAHRQPGASGGVCGDVLKLNAAGVASLGDRLPRVHTAAVRDVWLGSVAPVASELLLLSCAARQLKLTSMRVNASMLQCDVSACVRMCMRT
jgi:hypothetical protein